MFAGEFRSKIDSQGRLMLPIEFRSSVENPGERIRFFATVSLPPHEPCVRLYTVDCWNPNEMWIQPSFRSQKNHLEIGSEGEITIPKRLVDAAGLRDEVVLIGNYHWIEIWNVDEFRARMASLEDGR